MHIRVYGTPEAKRLGHKWEHMLVLAEMPEGILAGKGKALTVFLPWEYLSEHYYHYVN